MANITIIKHSIEEVVDVLEGVTSFDFINQKFFKHIGDELYAQTRDRFEKEQDPEGKPWVALTEKYAKRKAKNVNKKHNKKLQFGGGLITSMSHQATDYSVKFGSNSEYANTHQFGRGNIPARPFLGISEDDRKAITEEVIASWEKWFAKQG